MESKLDSRVRRPMTFRGETLGLMAWSRRTGISEGVLHARLRLGWSDERTLSTPVAKRGAGLVSTRKDLTYQGETRSIGGWARHLGINRSTLSHRLNSGWSVERALSTEAGPRSPRPRPEKLCFRGRFATVRQIAEILGVSDGVVRSHLRAERNPSVAGGLATLFKRSKKAGRYREDLFRELN